MRIAVVGAGGVGGYFGGRLAAAGEDVTFIAINATLEALRTRGLRVESALGDFVVEHVKATDDAGSVGAVDVVLMCVKAWQVAEATRSILPLLGKDTAVVPLENGMEAPETIAAIAGREHATGGLCAILSFIVEPGHIRHISADPFVMFGELDNRRSERLERLLDAFTRAGVKAEIPPDIHRSMWSKFLFIVPTSGVGAVTRVPISGWRSIPETRELAERAVREIIVLAAARGASLPDDAFERTMERYDALTPDATTSLQRDIMAGNPSELDAQLGAVVRMAAESGVAVPVCDFLYRCLLPQERAVR
jgi:2-dehydropantoate 2-reductase